MKSFLFIRTLVLTTMIALLAFYSLPGNILAQDIRFDHNHTFSEVVEYLNDVNRAFPDLTRLHVIGKSFLGNDLIVIEITNHETGDAMAKPAYWYDGNLHSSEVMGAEACLKLIDDLVKKYGSDPFITELVDTRTLYVMPKLNPDGSDHYLKNPDGMRSSVKPYDSDGDGKYDEDPADDLDGDRYIVQMRIKDETGPMKTSDEDPRLMVRCEEGEKGEWRVYSEGMDDDNDGRYNEDGVGGLDINRNWPAQWKQEYVQRGSGIYPLSEPETKAVAEFLFNHPNITGVVNHHMAGNFLYRPPNNRHFDPVTGEEFFMPAEDEANFSLFSRKYTEIINKQPVRTVFGRGAPPRMGAIWGVMIGWAYDHYGVFSWVPEMGSYAPFCDYDEDGRASQAERLRWNDEELEGRIFVDWKPFNHPQLGKVEIGGFISKIYNDKYKTYINMMCHPGPVFEDFLEKHTKWNLYLASMSPLIRLSNVKVESVESDIFRITAEVQNRGYLPTNVTRQAVINRTAKTVKAKIELANAEMITDNIVIDLGHLRGNRSEPVKVEWIVRTTGRSPRAVVKAVSEKGGTDTMELSIQR